MKDRCLKHISQFPFFQELANTKASTKERLQEVNTKNQAMEKELSKLRRDSETRLKEVKDDNAKLMKDVKILQERDDLEVSVNRVKVVVVGLCP